MPLEKDKSEEFIISKLLERIINLKKRIDRLVFLYISVTVFGIANFKCFKEISILGGLAISDSMLYHIGVVLSLVILFALIGSHLIEYVVKRNELDNRLVNNDVFKQNNKFDISKTIVPSSIYEYMYTRGIYDDFLRKLSVIVLFLCFFIGHGVSFVHLWLPYMPLCFSVIISAIIFAVLVTLYYVFLESVGRARLQLKKILRTLVLVFATLGLLAYIFITIKWVDFEPCQMKDKVIQKEPCSSSSTYIQ